MKQLIILITLLLSSLSTYADCDLLQNPKSNYYNPKPLSDDIELPMPCGLKMVFRKIIVPGQNFWGDEKRIIKIGDDAGDMFEIPLKASINGSFYDSKQWANYLGKYEVTKAQFIAVMGVEVFRAEVTFSSTNKTRKFNKAIANLAEPVSEISWPIFQEFIHQYNLWLFKNHLTTIPKHFEKKGSRYNQIPGFIRLPTELEWEYAVRGGYNNGKLAKGFDNKLPFNPDKINKYAWNLNNAKQLKRIGLKKPNQQGLYDVFGNVQELTGSLFLPEHWLGKPGGLIARGGDLDTDPNDLRSSLRKEVEIYNWQTDHKKMAVRRSYATGIRLAIGSNILVNRDSYTNLQQDHQQYINNIRDKLPVATALANTPAAAGAASSLQQATGTIGKLEQKNKQLIAKLQKYQNIAATRQQVQDSNKKLINRLQEVTNELKTINTQIAQAEQKLDLGLTEGAKSKVQDAWVYGVLMGQEIIRIAILNKSLVKLDELAKISTRHQEKVFKTKDKIAERKKYLGELFIAYVEKIQKLSGYDKRYVKIAVNSIKQRKQTVRSKIVVPLLKQHIRDYNLRTNFDKWLQEFKTAF